MISIFSDFFFEMYQLRSGRHEKNARNSWKRRERSRVDDGESAWTDKRRAEGQKMEFEVGDRMQSRKDKRSVFYFFGKLEQGSKFRPTFLGPGNIDG